MHDIAATLSLAPVIPVVTVEDAAHAVPLAEALVAGGVPVVEVTLRTGAAVEAIRLMRGVPGITVGAGTVLDAGQLAAAVAAGAAFVVSPGLTEPLARAARAAEVPFLPGAVTPTEIMRALDAGFNHLKFFPAECSGGAAAVKAFAAPFPDARFCATGGITQENAGRYLSIPTIACVGGTWMATTDVMRRGDWEAVRRGAAATLALREAGKAGVAE